MEYLDRYLEAVKKHLPWQRQDDILAELRANLESQLEEREEALGRPMRAAEAEAWVKELSPPIQVAAGYQPQQFLIGPAVFPTYRYVLKLACSWCMIVYAIVTVARFFAAPQPDTDTLLVAFLRIPGVLLITSAWITLIFAAIEYAMMHRFIPLHTLGPLSELWPPSLLTQHEPQTAGKKPPSYAKAVAEVIFGFLWLVWLLLIPQHPFLILGPGTWYVNSLPQHLAPVWVQFYWAVVALNIVQVGWKLESLWHGRWQRPQPLRQIVFQAMGIIPLGFVLGAPGQVLFLFKDPATEVAANGRNLNIINHYVYASFELIFVIVACKLVWDVAMLWRDYFRQRAAAIR